MDICLVQVAGHCSEYAAAETIRKDRTHRPRHFFNVSCSFRSNVTVLECATNFRTKTWSGVCRPCFTTVPGRDVFYAERKHSKENEPCASAQSSHHLRRRNRRSNRKAGTALCPRSARGPGGTAR